MATFRVPTLPKRMNDSKQAMRVAIIDNDSGFVRVLTNRMDSAGWQHRVMASAAPPQELVAMKVNAVLVDITVMGNEGWSYLEKICGLMPDLGVIVTMNGGTVSQRVRGLRLGADDWVNKPCHPEEVIARIEAVVRRRRRSRGDSSAGPVLVGEVEVRADQFQAFVAGVSLDLTRREFELLNLLAENEGNVLERETIYQQVWGYAMAHGDRSVDVFVRKLRQKIERRSPGYRYIHTHFGVGYRFSAEPVATGSPGIDSETTSQQGAEIDADELRAAV